MAPIQSAIASSIGLPSFTAPLIAVMSSLGTKTLAINSRACGFASEKPFWPIQ